MKLFISGIGTEIGKTVVSAVFTEALKADYWKPVQAGELDHTDSMKVKALISNSESYIHAEAYRLLNPLSPHAAAEMEGIEIEEDSIQIPQTKRNLIIEGAGGLMVPINRKFMMVDLIRRLGAEVVLVSRNYLGSINHTLMSIALLKQYEIPIKGIVFNGIPTPSSESLILEYSNLPCLLRIKEEEKINSDTILKYAEALNPFA
ncbi:MAG: dethiobiotin synthase [Bacteroidetes bacterium]|nr:dethiobiotin synthase [Bacteroidota bacterium]